MSNKPWIGFDLDGTLAHYDDAHGLHIGEPIQPMVDLLKEILYAKEYDVKIFTARVCNDDPNVRYQIELWCMKHIGKILPVTNKKDFYMVNLYDDRCVQVETNTGRIITETPPRKYIRKKSPDGEKVDAGDLKSPS